LTNIVLGGEDAELIVGVCFDSNVIGGDYFFVIFWGCLTLRHLVDAFIVRTSHQAWIAVGELLLHRRLLEGEIVRASTDLFSHKEDKPTQFLLLELRSGLA